MDLFNKPLLLLRFIYWAANALRCSWRRLAPPLSWDGIQVIIIIIIIIRFIVIQSWLNMINKISCEPPLDPCPPEELWSWSCLSPSFWTRRWRTKRTPWPRLHAVRPASSWPAHSVWTGAPETTWTEMELLKSQGKKTQSNVSDRPLNWCEGAGYKWRPVITAHPTCSNSSYKLWEESISSVQANLLQTN